MEIERAVKPRPRSELVMWLVRPLALRGVAWLARFDVDPQHVVLTHGCLGLIAAWLIAVGGEPWAWAAASALLGKVVLDNIDGGLARATGKVTLAGRYLDTVVDFVVNAALFVALATHGSAWLALLAFVILTLVLSFDFNIERLYRETRDGDRLEKDPHTPIGAPEPIYRVLRTTYRLVFAPQDAFVERIDRWTRDRVVASSSSTNRGSASPSGASGDLQRAWNDLFSTTALVNLGLSTQLTVFAAIVVTGRPFSIVWFVLLQAPYVLCVWLLRVWRFREYLRTR